MSARSQAGYLAYRARQRYQVNRRETRILLAAVVITVIPVVVLALLTGTGLLLALIAGLSGLVAGLVLTACLLLVTGRRPE